jgi:hypothetical protein
MAKLYQIVDWDKNFENNKSRTRAQCSFVCVPNKQHGMGFSRVMAEKDGAAIYGVWHLIVGACSQQEKREGWLTHDGHQTGTAWTLDDLALKFRRPEKEIERAIEVLSSAKVGWIKTYQYGENAEPVECSPSARVVPAECPSGALKRREEKEEKGRETPTLEEVKTCCTENGLTESDAVWFWNKCEANGWTNGGKPIKSWKHTIASWKAAGYMASQKANRSIKPQPFEGPVGGKF